MEPSFTIRLALPADAERIFAILSEVACQIPITEHVEALKTQIDDCCYSGLSYVAVDEDDDVVGVQLAKRARWFDDEYIHLTYAGVTAAAREKKILTRLIDAEKGHGLPLVAVVKPDNKSKMVVRLTRRYGFRSWWSGAPFDFAYRWDPEVTSG